MYLIDKKVYFNPVTGRVFNLKHEITLGEKSRECLMLLIETPGEVISKEKIITRVWNARGIIVSDNAVRQTMHVIRRAFKQLSPDTQIIMTVPNMGYAIISAQRVNEDDITLFQQENSSRTRQQRLDHIKILLRPVIWCGGKTIVMSFFLSTILSATYVNFFHDHTILTSEPSGENVDTPAYLDMLSEPVSQAKEESEVADDDKQNLKRDNTEL